MLIHPHALNFVDQDVSTTLERINPALNNARARDVANVQHAAAAEALSTERGNDVPAGGFRSARVERGLALIRFERPKAQ